VSVVSERPTIKDVAARAGVSIATVSRALNDKGDVSMPTREHVREVARVIGYSVDWAARSMATQKTRLVAVFVGDQPGSAGARNACSDPGDRADRRSRRHSGGHDLPVELVVPGSSS
jgi:transcriptional regulator with XRE-family HTH domain